MAIPPDELTWHLQKMADRVQQARGYLNFEGIRKRIAALEEEASRPGFWDDTEKAQEHMRTITRLKTTVVPWEKLEGEVSDALELSGMAGDDAEMTRQLVEQAEACETQLEALETLALMNQPDDINNVYFQIHAGQGGTESYDWAQMLLRMYTRWTEREGLAVEVVDLQEGEGAGIRNATLLIKGDYAYGRLKAEKGVHRLVRISPFDANKRRHTSFGSVHVWPEIDDAEEVEVRDEDLKVDTFRSQGAGGQHVNKTESAIRITHLPSKIVVGCQSERSQHQNRAQAMKMLKAQLYQRAVEEREAELAKKAGEKKGIGFGSQIRSYVFQPYQMVKDLRTGHETSNIQQVMDGDIAPFIDAWLRWKAGLSGPADGVEDLD